MGMSSKLGGATMILQPWARQRSGYEALHLLQKAVCVPASASARAAMAMRSTSRRRLLSEWDGRPAVLQRPQQPDSTTPASSLSLSHTHSLSLHISASVRERPRCAGPLLYCADVSAVSRRGIAVRCCACWAAVVSPHLSKPPPIPLHAAPTHPPHPAHAPSALALRLSWFAQGHARARPLRPPV